MITYKKTLLANSILLSSALLLTGCGGSGNTSTASAANIAFDAKASIDNLVDNVITADYTALNSRAEELLTAVKALQTGGATSGEMIAAQNAWKAARVPWESSEGFLFGPVDSLGIDPAIDSWPLNTGDLSAYLSSNSNATQSDVESLGDDLRGYHAIEFLLFGDGVNDNTKAATELTTAESNYLVALVEAFKAKTQILEDSWTTGFAGQGAYAETVKAQGVGKVFASQGAVLETIINAITGIVDEVGNAKMAEPFGTSAGAADTSKVESQYSWNSLTDFHENIQSVMNIYTGKLGFSHSTDTVSEADNGLYTFVRVHDSALADRIQSEIVDAQKKIALIDGDGDDGTTEITSNAQSPFRTQIGDATGRTLIQTAIDALTLLQTSLEDDVSPLVGKTDFSN